MAYLLDSNVILEAKNRYYPFDVCPAFWHWLLRENGNGVVLSIDAIAGELLDPDAQAWVRENRNFFVQSNDAHLHEVADWVRDQPRFDMAQRNRFLSGADARLISHAIASRAIVVTHEKSEPLSTKVKIPDVCFAFGVEVASTFDVLRILGARFVLETQGD